MAHEDQTAQANEGFATWHMLRVMAGEVKPTLGPAHFDMTAVQWARIKAETEMRVRKAAARILTAS